MIYGSISYLTDFDANFVNSKWETTYTMTQSRKNLSGIKEERILTFKTKINSSSFDSAYTAAMQNALLELSGYGFDLFVIPDNIFISLKERLENGPIKNNKTTKD